MRWQGRRESGNVEDRRGGGMGRPAGIGGIGLIIVLLVGIFFGVDLSPLLGPGGGGVVTETAPSGPNTIDDEQERFVAVVLAETEDSWGRRFQAAGLDYSTPRLVLFSGQTCRPAASRSRRWGRSTARTTRRSISTPASSARWRAARLARGIRQGLCDRARGRASRAGRAGDPRASELGAAAGERAGLEPALGDGSSCRPTATPGSGRTIRPGRWS